MKSKNKEIEKLLNSAKNYFSKEEKRYIFKGKKYGKLDPIPEFIVNEQIEFLKFSDSTMEQLKI